MSPVVRAALLLLAVLASIAGASVVAAKGPAGERTATPALPAIEGTNGPDRLTGTPRAETITGYLGDDVIDGGGGDDDIDGREGADRITTPAGPGAVRIAGGPGPDRVVARGSGDAVLHGMGGRDRLTGGPGADAVFGGPGYDVLRGGRGDDRLEDVSDGAGLLDGGAGDDLIRSAPRGMDRVRCGEGRDTVVADVLDIVGADCEVIDRTGPTRRGEPAPAARITAVRSLAGALLGTTGHRIPAGASGPLRLLWINDGFTYLSARFRGDDACFMAVEPSGGGRAECGVGPRGALFVRRIDARRFRWFALTPAWARTLAVGGRTVPVSDGVAVFTAGRRPGRVVVRDGGRSVTMRVP